MEEIKRKKNIEIVLRQTTLTEQEIIEKLILHDNNVIDVIRDFYGINVKKDREQIKISGVNQEIYKQIRNKFYETKEIK